jgi:DNA-binding GntR family transcriptional regulator
VSDSSSTAEASAFASIVARHGRQFRTVGDMVYEVLRESILMGVFRPGERLRQDQLAEAIGVSRIPVRSALMQLDSEGLITFNAYRGAVVNKLTIEQMREIYSIRSVLETHALRNAIGDMTPERLEHLEQLARELNEVKDGEEFLIRRNEFYSELYDVEKQPYLVGLIERLRAETGRYWLQRKIDYVSRPGHRDHVHLMELVRAGDADGAVEALRDHLQRVCDELVVLMEEGERVDG